MSKYLSVSAKRSLHFPVKPSLRHVVRVCFRCASNDDCEVDPMKFFKDNVPTNGLKLLPVSKYGGETFVTLLTGPTLIGQQGGNYIKNLFATTKVPVEFERIAVGENETSPHEYVMSVLRNRSAIHVDLQHDPRHKQKSLWLNNELDLSVCVIDLQTYPGYNCKFEDVNMSLVFQNNTGDFKKLEYEPVAGIVQTLRFSSDKDIRKFFKFAFDYATKHNRKKITVGHKARELPKTDGRFIDIALQLKESDYPAIEIEPMSIDKVVLNLIMEPQQFDMICANDRYGTFLASISSAVCGGPSLFSCCEKGEHHAIFKPLQTKLSLTDTRVLSPYGIVRSCIDLLRHLGYTECGNTLEKELLTTMLECEIKTPEYGGENSGEFVICHIVNRLKCKFA